MTLQLNFLDILPGQEAEFEKTFSVAVQYLVRAEGYRDHSLHCSVETPGRYLLLVQWNSMEDHTVTFRLSPDHLLWKNLLDPFYVIRPQSVHFSRS